jgi:hypothetical protein
MEVARRVLGAYSGIWRLTSTILFVLGVTALVYSIAAAQHGWADVVLSADRALELSIATFVVAMLAFARYYRLPMTNLERQLTIGFCLFSCSWVISNSIFQLAQNPSAPWWEFVQILAFCATLAIWILAVRKPVVVAAPNVLPTLAPDQYAELSHQVNSRLHQLNERLDHLFNPEDPRA